MKPVLYWMIALVCCLLSTPSAIAQEALKGEELYQKVLPSTMTLIVEKRDGTKGVGTAFMAIKEGMAVTAWHVVNNARRVTAKFASGEEFETSGLVDRDTKRDVALIRVKVFGRPLLTVTPNDPAVGSKAFVIGAPKGLDFSFSDGLISQVRTFDGYKQYQFTCDVSRGNSGGPVLNGSGEVIGVVSWQVRDAQNVNFAVPGSYALALDATLPTQPWEAVKETAEPVSAWSGSAESAASVSADDFDRLLADSLTSIREVDVVRTIIYEGVVMKRSGYEHGMPIAFYTIMKSAKMRQEELRSAIPPDPVRRRQKQALLSYLDNNVQAADLLEVAIRNAQRDDGYTSETSDILKKSLAIADSEVKSLSEEDRAAMIRSKVFVETLPKEMRYLFGVEATKGDFALGIISYPRTPLLISFLEVDSLASKMGFKAKDTIVSAGAVTFACQDEFRVFVQENAGKKVKVRVIRNDKEQEIELKIPMKLTQR
jgi:S1-C subfamily serine protease